ncbi:MAG: sulfurtransferase TusA family protein [Oligoflexia bacterium]|nr:sulfurtransferase TusA family protein [Oligoflexia bacterium]
MSNNLNDLKATKTVDARSMACPGSLLEAKKAIITVNIGEVLEILSSDQGSREDLPAWCKKTGNEYLGHLKRDGYDSIFVLRKK